MGHLFLPRKGVCHVNWLSQRLEFWTSLHPSTRRLIETRFLRSIGQGALGVDFTLYLAARGWDAGEIGLLLMGGGLANAALSLLVGVTSDRFGRKGFLLLYELGLILATAAIAAFPHIWILILSAVLFGFGRGANGNSGPFAPAEQAWLAQHISGKKRGSVFSFNAALQFWGMAIGSALAGILPHLLPGVVGAAAYLPLFLLNLFVAVVNFVQIVFIQDDKSVADEVPESATTEEKEAVAAQEQTVRKRENRALLLLLLVNLVNSLGVGLVAPLLPYWFDIRFGVGPTAIGSIYAITFILTGISSIGIGKLSQRVGLVSAITLPRLLGVAMLIAMPFVPTFGIASTLYVVRSIVNRGSMGARQAFSVGLVRNQRRGFASSLNNLSWSLAASFGPAIGGWLLDMGSLFWPFVIASALQLAYVILFTKVMGKYDPTSNRTASAGSKG
jgi:MFS family permease